MSLWVCVCVRGGGDLAPASLRTPTILVVVGTGIHNVSHIDKLLNYILISIEKLFVRDFRKGRGL